ncbi:MAG: hypothetical protein ACRDZQ_03875, partial [Acidimicrobiales bacterium]
MGNHVPIRVSAQLGRQLGLITLDQARHYGMSQTAVRRCLRQGRWAVAARRLYRVTDARVTWDQRALGACLLAGPGAVASHGAARRLLGLGSAKDTPIEVLLPAGRMCVLPVGLGIVHRTRRLDGADVASVGPVPVTGPGRTLVDLAPRLSMRALEWLVDEMLSRRMTSRDALLRRVAALSGRGRPGAASLRQVLEAWSPGPPAGSEAEMHLIRLLVGRGIAEPSRQHPIIANGRVVAVVDAAWPVARLALELDSERWHGGGLAYHRDKDRTLRIEAAGWHLLSVTPRLMEGPSLLHLLEAIRSGLSAARPAPAPAVPPTPAVSPGDVGEGAAAHPGPLRGR